MKALLFVALFGGCVVISGVQGAGCDANYGGCDKVNGHCWDTGDSTSYCTCKAGYKFRTEGKTSCIDIDECKTTYHGCDTKHGRCRNTIGSYECTCRRSYMLDYTRNTCLKKSEVKGRCVARKKKRRRRRYKGDALESTQLFMDTEEKRNKKRRCGLKQGDEMDAEKRKRNRKCRRKKFRGDALKFMQLFTDSDKRYRKRRRRGRRCGCEPGFEKRKGCGYCQDIDECRRGISMCDKTRGTCHNSDGGYYCTCAIGYVVGPCGFICYKPDKRPTECLYTNFKTKSLVSGDSDGLNDEISKSQFLNFITEKRRKIVTGISTFLFTKCPKKKVKTQKLDLDRDGKTDLVVMHACGADGIYHPKSAVDSEAKWRPWTCWTVCKATCSGGIQTRSRICKNGLVGEGRCKGPATRVKQCYKGGKCKTRVRREAHSLTTAQKNDLIQAMEKYKADQTASGFHNAAGTHVFPYQCMGTDGKRDGCCYHGAKLNFAMWHRAEVMNFEEGLARYLKDKTLGLPYWNWLKYPEPPTLVWDKTINGKANPFASAVIRNKGTTQRTPTVDAKAVTISNDTYFDVTRTLMRTSIIHEFSEALENAHNTIHSAICILETSACEFSMGGLTYAAFDPIFFFHHTNVDRLFSVFQDKVRKKLAWTRQSALEPQENIYRFNEPYMPYGNASLTPFKKLQYLNSMQDLYYYRRLLGYRYDTLKPREDAKSFEDDENLDDERAIIRSSDELRLAQYERSTRFNVRIRYFISNKLSKTENIAKCNALADSNVRYLGSATILGSRRERRWKSRQPTIVDIQDKLFAPGSALATLLQNNRINPDSDIQIKACYSKLLYCNKNCAEISKSRRKLIPSPQLLFQPKLVDVEVFKFEWNVGERFPTWEIDLRAVKQWIYFWGKHASNVYQVKTRREYRRCDRRKGKKIDCAKGCILPQGTHYFVNGDKKRCRAGMRLNILAGL